MRGEGERGEEKERGERGSERERECVCERESERGNFHRGI